MTSKDLPDVSDIAVHAWVAGSNGVHLQSVYAAHPYLSQVLQPYDPVYAASVVGGLLTVPILQGNCCRLEVLVHAAVACGSGKKKLPKTLISTWFSELSSGPCGRFEDPPEDTFTTIVTSPRGNFRIIEGVWESAAFFLQRFVNIIESMPQERGWNQLRDSVYALLKLSDLICERSNLPRYVFENDNSHSRLPKELQNTPKDYMSRVTFSESDLRSIEVTPRQLKPFVFPLEFTNLLADSSTTHSPLLHHPLLIRNGDYVVALPTAISIAIRTMVAGSMIQDGLRDPFVKAMAAEYADFFRKRPPLGVGRNAPIFFQSTENGMMACLAKEVETGHWFNIILVLDTLEGFTESGFAGSHPNPLAVTSDIESLIEESRQQALRNEHFREGLTVIVGCGIGRASAFAFHNEVHDDWRVDYVSAADLANLSLLGGIKPQTLWRLSNATDKLADQNVTLVNLSGLANLIAWVRSQDGHLVEHSQVPEEFGTGNPCSICIDSSMIVDLRLEVTNRIDSHSVLSTDGQWVDIRKTGDSYFEEDRNLPLYVCCDSGPEAIIPMVFITSLRNWWCHVTYPRDYQRWKILNTWLPKLAVVVDREVTELAPGPITLKVKFNGFSEQPSLGDLPDQNGIKQNILVDVNAQDRELTVQTDETFENGLASPDNISEAALVQAIVEGVLTLAGSDRNEAEKLLPQIIPDKRARSCHLFSGRSFRDFVRGSLSDSPVTVDPIDDANHRLGLGWSIRNRAEGSEIKGKSACTAYLNELVSSELKKLCKELQRFSRESLIEMALKNHEAAMVHQGTWRRTAAANLALHADQSAALNTIFDREFLNNGALQASRVLVELAVCECPHEGGLIPCSMDLSELMARLLHSIGLGGWSDAIHLEAIPPEIHITPLGDVQVDSTFYNTIVEPFGRASSEKMLDVEISKYESNFLQPEPSGAIEPEFDPAFVSAWAEEFGFGIDELRKFADEIEDLSIREKQAVLTTRQSDILSLTDDGDGKHSLMLSAFSTIPRPDWHEVPSELEDKDRWPWRFRRRLSLLRLPIVQLDNSNDPLLFIAPGLLRDAIGYTAIGYHDGSFPPSQIRSSAMRSWLDKASNIRGAEFNKDVARRMEELGWITDEGVDVTKILRRGFEENYGDVDVLAWNETSGRVLLMECKHLHFHKTPGELASQLSHYRGKVREGKKDQLKRHLDRCEILTQHIGEVARFLRLDKIEAIETWVVFRNPVPMLFAWKDCEGLVSFTTFDQLSSV